MRISPTQLATHRSCARRYAWEYVANHKPGPTPAMARGTAIHAILEDYLNGKGPIDATTEYGAIAQAGVQYLPQPGEGRAEVELHLIPEFPSPPFEFFGKIDLLTPLLVLDHKTTSDFRYAKTPDVLRVDPQAVLYSKYGFEQFPETYQGHVRYVYYLTAKRKTAQARAVDFCFDRAEVTDRFAEVSAEAEKLYQIRTTKPDPLSLPPNLSHCNDYGGCPHRSLCTDLNSTEDIIRRIMLPGKDDLMSRLLAEAGVTPAVAPVEPVVASTPPVTESKAEEPDAEALLMAQLEKTRADKKAKAEAETARIEAERVAKQALDEISALGQEQEKAEAKAEEKPRGRGRPPGAKNKAKEGETKSAESKPIGTLYVDCLPVGEDVYRADTLFAIVRHKVTEALKVPHYKLVEYGKGVGVWSEAVREQVVADFSGEDLFVDSRTLEGTDALSALSQCASTIVRGLR